MTPSKPYVIGITGGIACGKSHVARTLRELSVPVLDADAISRSLTAPGGKALPRIREVFGDGVFSEGNLNRAALASLVFSDPQAKARLEAILHPMIIGQIKRELLASSAPIVALDVPLLYETGMDRLCREVWCVHVDEAEQLRRVMRRDALSYEDAVLRLTSQWPLKEKMQRAHFLIDSSGDYAETNCCVAERLDDVQRRLNGE